MLRNLVENLLIHYGFALSFTDIKDLIREDIGFVPIELELQLCLDNAITSKQLFFANQKYDLTEENRRQVTLSLAEENEIQEKRFSHFEKLCPSMSNSRLSKDEIKQLWTIYNEYLIKCFLEFGKKATEIFLPNSRINDLRTNGFITEATNQLNSESLRETFIRIVQEYPDKLVPAEIRYLDALASRAEKVFSLGLQKEELDKIQNLTFKDVIIFADTNVLYQVLGLSDHAEDEAVQQIVSIAKNKEIDIRIVMLARTLKELRTAKEELEKRIPKQNLNPAHIRALLKSPDLDSFSRKFYEQKLTDSDTAHPSVKVGHALDHLRLKGIELYNHKFPHLEDDSKHLDAKMTEYFDWVSSRNEQRLTVGLHEMRYKSDKQVEHDVYLREALVYMRRKVRAEHEVKYICLTLDKRLVDFDQYESRRSMAGQFDLISPLFMSPSVFISKIRPFLPIQTDNYAKAFVKALICATPDTGDSRKSELLQRSFSYFVKQGLEDEAAIGNIIRRELFLKEFEEEESIGMAEEFIRSEVNEELDRTRSEVQLAKDTLARMEMEVEETNIQTQKITQKYLDESSEKDNKIAEKEGQIIDFREKFNKMAESFEKQQKNFELSELKSEYYRELSIYQANRWNEFEKNYRKGRRFLSWFSIGHLAPIVLAYFLSQGTIVKQWLAENNLSSDVIFWIVLILTAISGAGLLVYRTLFVDKPEKELAKITWNYMWGDKEKIKEKNIISFKKEFETNNPKLAHSVANNFLQTDQ